jgi:isopenicillin N synthase-like dioxygenase
MRTIPLVNVRQYAEGSDQEKAAFVQQLGQAFHEVGFVGIINHGIEESLVQSFYALSKSFFALPDEVKARYEVPGLAGQRGYTSFGKEHAKQSNVGDLKEFYQIGQGGGRQ